LIHTTPGTNASIDLKAADTTDMGFGGVVVYT
jgi:hypothetical protein